MDTAFISIMILSTMLLSCAAPQISELPPQQQAKIVRTAAGKPPGFYPGLLEDNVPRWEYEALIRDTKPTVLEIESRIKGIQQGQINPGCIGEDVLTCAGTIAQTLAVTTDHEYRPLGAGADIFTPDKVDVNGKVIFANKIGIYAYVPGWQYNGLSVSREAVSFTLQLGDDRKVQQISIHLPRSPVRAQTREEYDRTGIYEIVSPILSATCPKLEREEFYRFFENSVKEKLPTQSTKNISAEGSDISVTKGKQAGASLCGRSLLLHTFSGHSTSLVSEYNETGFFAGDLVIIQ